MENKEKQVRKIAQRVMTKYKLHPPVDMMGLIQEKGITSYSDSRLLIKEILSEMYTDDKNIKKASHRINGIIGSALSHRETMTKEEIYNLLNIKLRRSNLAEFVFHRKFEKFIYSKSVEKGL